MATVQGAGSTNQVRLFVESSSGAVPLVRVTFNYQSWVFLFMELILLVCNFILKLDRVPALLPPLLLRTRYLFRLPAALL